MNLAILALTVAQKYIHNLLLNFLYKQQCPSSKKLTITWIIIPGLLPASNWWFCFAKIQVKAQLANSLAITSFYVCGLLSIIKGHQYAIPITWLRIVFSQAIFLIVKRFGKSLVENHGYCMILQGFLFKEQTIYLKQFSVQTRVTLTVCTRIMAISIVLNPALHTKICS